MSHVEVMEMQIKDKEALRLAAEKCDLILVEKKFYNWYGHSVGDWQVANAATVQGHSEESLGKCDFALVQKDSALGIALTKAKEEGRTLSQEEIEKLSKSQNHESRSSQKYEIGVLQNAEGNYDLLFDRWNGGYGLIPKIGEKAEKLFINYQESVADIAAGRAGHKRVEGHTVLEDGSIRIRYRVPQTLSY